MSLEGTQIQSNQWVWCVNVQVAADAPPDAIRGVVLLNTAGAMNNKGLLGDWRIMMAYPLLLFLDFVLSVPQVRPATDPCSRLFMHPVALHSAAQRAQKHCVYVCVCVCFVLCSGPMPSSRTSRARSQSGRHSCRSTGALRHRSVMQPARSLPSVTDSQRESQHAKLCQSRWWV